VSKNPKRRRTSQGNPSVAPFGIFCRSSALCWIMRAVQIFAGTIRSERE
jgi:hypothetical protein